MLYKILLNHLINFKIPTVDKKIIAKPLLKRNEKKIENIVDNLTEANHDIAMVINKKLKSLSEEKQDIKSKIITLSNSNKEFSQKDYNGAIELLLVSDHETKRQILSDIIEKIKWNGHNNYLKTTIK